ncbi:energy-coupling factor ABC transporter ATP-binding protein [Sulfitobacter sp. S190]|uniref:energy-coupling factor ABC transporter ATP-binding protein n=1 Tax=Sulfitobacter sp. S190 TaxID=2867022 RepID=UPI0021A465B2|nr:ABC transporter ATP-binding protein [Sulfitobacter sp. S190]UWR22814.1 energy-coupling factor ABC transporter ATP-binding protein [Sulfitobacter sp. S190]
MPSDLIDLENIHLVRDGTPVLGGVTLRASERRIAVLGRNGSGKTTLARVMAGVLPVDRGRVRIAGVDVARDRRGALGAVGLLFQNPDQQIIFPTVAEELGFGRRQQGRSAAEVAQDVDEVLARFGKRHWHHAAIARLSQGQRQLVCLMAIVMMQPRVIVLDEPFAGLDIPTAMHLTRTLSRIDACVVHITHDPGSVAGYDRALWIEGGAVAQDGPAPQVAAAYQARMEAIGAVDDLSDLAG